MEEIKDTNHTSLQSFKSFSLHFQLNVDGWKLPVVVTRRKSPYNHCHLSSSYFSVTTKNPLPPSMNANKKKKALTNSPTSKVKKGISATKATSPLVPKTKLELTEKSDSAWSTPRSKYKLSHWKFPKVICKKTKKSLSIWVKMSKQFLVLEQTPLCCGGRIIQNNLHLVCTTIKKMSPEKLCWSI